VKSLEFRKDISMMLIPLGFSMLVAGLAFDFSSGIRNLLLVVGVVGALGGIIWLNRLFKEIEKEDKQKQKSEDDFNTDILAILKDIRDSLKK
jgi:hypothetical protein